MTPALWLFLVCLVLAILLWPPLLEQVVSLNWKICDLHPVAFGSQLLMAVMAIIIFVGRRQVDKWLSLHKPSGKTLVFTLVTLSFLIIISLAAMESACASFVTRCGLPGNRLIISGFSMIPYWVGLIFRISR